MKGDITRNTFDPRKHFNSVRMQQGRVQLDADWNEQQDITLHRIETEAVDVIGGCGGPLHHAGFHLVVSVSDLTADEQLLPENQLPAPLDAGDFYISGGRYYVNGILCENDHIVPYSSQPDYPVEAASDGLTNPSIPIPAAAGAYLAYLDVWNRHITVLEDDEIREVALGGPDTATRLHTAWQVKLHALQDASVNCLSSIAAWEAAIAPGTGKISALAEQAPVTKDLCIVAPDAGYRRLENQLYRLEVHVGGNRNESTFKWSRDNGAYISKWDSQNATFEEITVSSAGRDDVSRFAAGQWLELIDDEHELLGVPGTLVQITKVVGQVVTLDLTTATGTVKLGDHLTNPRVRRWDGLIVHPTNADAIDLEDGVQVKIFAGTFKPGDYWQIPARTATGDVEWPLDPATNKAEQQLPHGIRHQYCRLAIMVSDGATWTSITDCRKLFPPVTELTSLFYVGGSGQETMPSKPALPLPLEAGVANGQWPVKGASVRFTITKGNGQLSGGLATVTVSTNADGIASCNWSVDTVTQVQEVTATLLNANGDTVHIPVRFNANLSVASEVAFDPGKCDGLKNQNTVQDAIIQLAGLVSLYKVSGDAQHGGAGETIKPLVVLAASDCGIASKMKVTFTVISGGGSVTPASVNTAANGMADCKWTLGNSNETQEVEAELIADERSTAEPRRVRFTANIGEAGNDPEPVHIVGLGIGDPGNLLANGANVDLGILSKSVFILCDKPLDEVTVIDPVKITDKAVVRGEPTCFITAEIPFPLLPQDREMWNLSQLAGYQPTVLHAQVSVKNGTTTSLPDVQSAIQWSPEQGSLQFLNRVLDFMKKATPSVDRLLLRLTVKGNFIWNKIASELLKEKILGGYLDGEALRVTDNLHPTKLGLPSGDDRRGGDFEMWFWLSDANRPPITFNPAVVNFGAVSIRASKTQILTVTNPGDAPFVITGVAVNNQTFTVESPAATQLPLTLAANSSIEFTIRFTPKTISTFSGELTISSDDARQPQTDVLLEGQGTQPINRLTELNRVTGVNVDNIKLLERANIRTAEDLANMNPEQLVSLLGISRRQADVMIVNARRAVEAGG